MAMLYNKIRVSGTMPGGEVWSINPGFGSPDAAQLLSFNQLALWAAAIAQLNTNRVLPDVALGLLSSACTVTQVRAEQYDTDGTLQSVAEYNLPTPATGAGAPNKPYQTAVVVSLRTGRPGRSYRGRLYMPALNATISTTTLRMDSATQIALAEGMAGWLNTVADAAGADPALRPMVVSQTLGINSEITSVEVGNILDTQRRRRDALAEGYVVRQVPT